MDKILIVGGSGLLGGYLFHEMRDDYHLFRTYCNATPPSTDHSWLNLDISQPEEVDKIVRKLKPDVIINSAAMTNVDHCEREPEQARIINARGPEHIARASAKIGALLVQVSTDYVFDGQQGLYTEDDQPNPVDIYGASKLIGEEAVRSNCSEHLICRTSVLYGWADKPNFATWLLEGLRKGKEMTVVTDQLNSPTYAADLAAQIRALFEADCRGIYHTSGANAVTRMEFAQQLARTYELDSTNLRPVLTSELNLLAKRPADSSLNISKVSKFKKPQSIFESLNIMKAEELK